MRRSCFSGILFAILAISVSSPAWAVEGFLDYMYRQRLAQRLEGFDSPMAALRWWNIRMVPLKPGPAVVQGAFDQVLDPSNPSDQRMFKQRYYINSSYASGPEAPVFFVVCGEATCSSFDLDGAPAAYAMKYRAHLVALEHRYYGLSQPFPDLSTESLQYLRVGYALADMARFEAFARKELGLTGKWIGIGGAYSGALSAFYREKFPNMVVGALASSAPVMATDNFEEYDWAVARNVTPACANAMRFAVKKVEDVLNDPAKLKQAKMLFNAENISDPADFLYVMADMGAAAVQYGMKDEFCNSLLKGDPLAGYAQAGTKMLSSLGVTPEQDSFQWAASQDYRNYAQGFGSRQWLFQDCTELGYWQNAFHDPAQSVRSPLINSAFHQRMCQQLFGITAPANIMVTNMVYFTHLYDRTTNQIFFTNGSEDPWAFLSIDPRNHNALSSRLTSYMILGGSHCRDLQLPASTDTPYLREARSMFETLLNSWL